MSAVKTGYILAAILILALLILPGLLPGAADGPAPRRFFLAYSVNNAGSVDVCGCKFDKVKQGSVARRFTLIEQMRALGTPFLLLDGGSCFFEIQTRSPRDNEIPQLKAKAFVVVESMNRMGYQAMAMGSSDLLLGIDTLRELARAARFPILCANFFAPDGSRIFPSHTILEAGGVRVGVIGLVSSSLGVPYLRRTAPGHTAGDMLEAAAESVAELTPKTDLIVALSHARKEENQKLAEAFPQISVIFDPNINYGSHGMFIPDPSDYADRFGETLVIRADGEGMRLCRLDIEFEHPFGVIRTSPELNRLDRGIQVAPIPDDMRTVLGQGDFNRGVVSRVSVEPHILADPGITLLVDTWKRQDPGEISAETLSQLRAAPVKFLGKDACRDCHRPQYDFWLTTTHATAMKSLEATGDHLRYDCIGCHTVGFGQTFLHPKDIGAYAGVQCESCHGANPTHVDDPDGAPPWEPVTELTCLHCHNERQLRIPFDYPRALKKVACPKDAAP